MNMDADRLDNVSCYIVTDNKHVVGCCGVVEYHIILNDFKIIVKLFLL